MEQLIACSLPVQPGMKQLCMQLPAKAGGALPESPLEPRTQEYLQHDRTHGLAA